MQPISELRKDIVSGDWVVIATGRGKRPDEFRNTRKSAFRQPRETCPFEALLASRLVYRKDGMSRQKDWWVQVVPNKYPAFGKGICALFNKKGPYEWTEGVGFHEVVISRDHTRTIAMMTDQETELIIRAYQQRILVLREDACVEYISIFHNQGRLSGASIAHPHSQIIAIPVVPPDFAGSLKGSGEYFRANKKCVHCTMINFELQEKARIIYENQRFVVLAPYASRTAFEMRIFPKEHAANFETITDTERMLLANALRTALAKLGKGLKNPDLNFFLHTAPTGDARTFSHYHWHFEILPKTAIWAGFEIGTGIEISTIAPEHAAEFLRGVTV